MVYLGLFYYFEGWNLCIDFYDFMGILFNVYVFFLLVVGVIVIVVVNFVIDLIVKIGEKLSWFELG